MTAWGNYGMTPLNVILTMLLVRMPAFREKRDRHEENCQSLFSPSSSGERSEHLKFDLSRLFKVFSVQ